MNKALPILTATLAWLLAAFFLFGAYGNTFLSEENAAAYAAWGYPGWFHYVTAALELTAALLLLRAITRSLWRRARRDGDGGGSAHDAGQR